MFELINIYEDAATRMVELRNTQTGRVELCFDDSCLVCSENFEFMEIGKKYDCKIKLFGNFEGSKKGKGKLCKIINDSVEIGGKPFIQVDVEANVYYIPKKKIQGSLEINEFYFHFTRKDLVQVDDVINIGLI